MISGEIDGAAAWTGAAMGPADWTVTLPDAAQAELAAALARYRDNPLPTVLLDPADFALDACRAVMRGVRARLERGAGFALVDRLPVETMTVEEAKALYWLLCCLTARPVAQKLVDGSMLYDVLDTGAVAAAGSDVRPDKTSIEINLHNDNSYNTTPPEFMALLCLRPGKTGGASRVVSFATLHNRLRARVPNLLPRLYEPFWHDRMREHRPEEPPTHAAPVFDQRNGRLVTRLTLFQIRNGYTMRGEALDDAGAAALAAIEAVLADPDICAGFAMAAGQIQFLNNLAVGHSRTAFTDHEDPARRRHVVRIWMRDHGHRGYRG